MLPRRIKEHIQSQNWFAVFIDFVIVVVGIVLAFQITEWAQDRSDRKRERQIIAEMLVDLDIDRRQYAIALNIASTRVSAANASLIGAQLPPFEFDPQADTYDVVDYSFDLSEVPPYPDDQLEQLWTDIVLGYHPTPTTSTYDTLVGAGDIRIIRDREIVRAIQAYRSNAQTVDSQTDKLLSIREEVMHVGAMWGLAPYRYLPSEDYFTLVAENPQLEASIRIMATFVIYHYGDTKEAYDRAGDLQRLLREYLGSETDPETDGATNEN